jgi:Tfp pilus assembly PilM family ATPase
MSNNKKLGVCWGDDGISLIEVNKDSPGASVQIPFSAVAPDFVANTQDLTGGLALLESLQKNIRNQNFSTSEVYLSLPSREVIVRWIVIPFMKSTDIQGVVSFEARKYIPFPLEELVYTYYPSPFTKDGLKQIGILLIAIRKTAFDYYINVLTQSGLNVVYSEPSSMSLVRALVLRKTIDIAQTVAIINIVKDYGELIITSNGFVKFIRDFKITLPAQIDSPEAKDAVQTKLFSELRLSLDFFSRQHTDSEVSKVIAFADVLNPSVCAAVSEDLGIPVQLVTPLQILPGIDLGVDLVNAFGTALSGNVTNVIDFNLCVGEGGNKQEALRKEQQRKKTPPVVIPVIAGAVCAAVVFFSWAGLEMTLKQKQDAVQALSERLGVFAEIPLSEIEAKKNEEAKKKAALDSLPLHSDLVPLLIRLIDLMPPGVWFESMKVSFNEQASLKRSKSSSDDGDKKQRSNYYPVEKSRRVQISGYAYLNDTNTEFRKVNDFLVVLRDDGLFSAGFKAIKLGTLQSEKKQSQQVTSFTLDCE